MPEGGMDNFLVLRCGGGDSCRLVIEAAGIGVAVRKGDDHRSAADFAIVIDLTRAFPGRRQGHLKGFKT